MSVHMGSDAQALPRPLTPADHIARWLDHFRDRINLNALDAQARKPVRIIVAGPRAGELVAVLDPDAAPLSTVFETAGSTLGPVDEATRAFVYVRAVDDPPMPDVLPSAGAALPVFIVEYQREGVPAAAPLVTSGPDKRPSRERPGLYRLSALTAGEMRKQVLHDLVIACAGLEVALGAALPVFRPTVAAKLTLDCAVTCLKVGGASALADHVPLLGLVLGGIASAGDTIAITGLQVDMLLKISAAYGKRADFSRVVELLPVIGGGYGWRTLARELSGFIPVAGIAIKAGIAYAGTLVVGQAAAYYYEHGKPLTSGATSALYHDALERAKKLVGDAIDRARKKK
jgi:uncharacterized protein (DUF697 family)